MRRFAGIPCPTCGGTRVVVALLSGRIVEAFRINPPVFVALAGFALFAGVEVFCATFKLPCPRLRLARVEKYVCAAFICAVFLAHWIVKNIA